MVAVDTIAKVVKIEAREDIRQVAADDSVTPGQVENIVKPTFQNTGRRWTQATGWQR